MPHLPEGAAHDLCIRAQMRSDDGSENGVPKAWLLDILKKLEHADADELARDENVKFAGCSPPEHTWADYCKAVLTGMVNVFLGLLALTNVSAPT